MIDLKDAYKEYETPYGNFSQLECKCEYCDQEFNNFVIHLSILLYGIANFIRKDLFYSGITCPSCLKTNLFMGCDLEKFIDDISLYHGDDIHSYLHLRYHSGFLHSPDQYPELKKFQIPYVFQGLPENFYDVIYSYSSEAELDQKGYLCSFGYHDPLPIGANASVWWYLPDQIESLVELENEMGIKMFPRYVHAGSDSFFDRFDKFCWNYKINLDLLGKMEEHSHNDLRKLKEIAKAQNINFDNLLEQNPGIGNPDQFEYFLSQQKESLSKDVKAPSEFFDLLINFDPYFLSKDLISFNAVLKTVSPFKEDIVPKTPEEINFENFHASLTDDQVTNIIDQIRHHKDKKCVHEWLQENFLKFIDDYVSLFQKIDFTYGDVWNLKLNYLEQLQNYIKTNLKYEAEYVFVQQGEGWLIRFGEEIISGLTGKGFKYLHYLVLNQNNDFSHKDLDIVDGVGIEHIMDVKITKAKHEEESKSKYDEEKSEQPMHLSTDFHKQDLISFEIYQKLRNEYQRLKSEKEKAELDGDILFIKETEKKYNDFVEFYADYFTKGGKVKKFTQKEFKNTKNKISVNIKRALEKIKRNNPVLWEHFANSLPPKLYKNKIYYRPSEDIEWCCE